MRRIHQLQPSIFDTCQQMPWLMLDCTATWFCAFTPPPPPLLTDLRAAPEEAPAPAPAPAAAPASRSAALPTTPMIASGAYLP
eukprot:CAMPEP_0171174064 /NCGR_PEP_ID=MMETSP0790-20130122/10538_1 /TAXON_ID=2925 /ORGANISM="Alexandrium catenella, Strain OF101" /LENGTH=82 /DNA_ID=CAMNT_0011638933 /DNA_START=202 /DNA_END=446 /DNA_ORIENTATION=-